ncbi:MAG: DEAD/DEAH box helicase [Clostridia bacterium]|nr:DEAD/DEAH box helicase [Clostridia bacterium]
MQLRPYQKAAVQSVQAQWASGNKHTLLVLPTGTGKTVIFAEILKGAVNDGKKALVLAHRDILLEQAADKIKSVTGLDCALEKAQSHSAGTLLPITLGSVQTLSSQKRLSEHEPKEYDVIVVDEAHHAASPSYRRVLDYFATANLLGVTATPDRGDKLSLGEVFDTVAFEYPLPTAIREGYLSPISVRAVPLDIDFSHVGVQAGDFKADDIGKALEPYLWQIAREMTKYCKDRRTVVFLPLIAISQKFRDILCEVGLPAVEVNGTTENRDEILSDFESGKYRVLCNSMLLTEGWDCPSVDCVVVLRPTKVRSLYAQMIGRGTRLCKGKKNLLVLDFLWHTGRHELVHPANLVCDDDKQAKKVTEKLENTDKDLDLLEADAEVTADVVAEREESLRKQLEEEQRRLQRARERAEQQTAQEIDPLRYEMRLPTEHEVAHYLPEFMWEYTPPSDKQKSYLERLGYTHIDTLQTKGQASMVIDRLVKRQQCGLATYKQVGMLSKYSIDGEYMSKSEAKTLISAIQKNGWRVPTQYRHLQQTNAG